MMRLSRYGGTPNIGVYAVANESFAFIASDSTDEFVRDVEETLDVKAYRTSVAGSFVVGSLVAMNSNGAIVSGLAEGQEIQVFKKCLPVSPITDRLNAAGNNILVNDNGAIVNPQTDDATLAVISDTLGVECVRASIAGIVTVGSVCRATNKGAIVHPDASDEDLALVKDVLNVNAVRTTLNHGSRFLAPCTLANSKGALVGDLTTPIEMGKVEDAFDLY